MGGGANETVRLFVAVYPPASVAGRMSGAVARLGVAKGRATPEEQVHLTLVFIGDRRVKELASVAESVQRSESGIGAFDLRPLRLVTLPRGHARPRLVAMETDAPGELLELQRRLALRLARKARPREKENFLPHLTLWRFAHTARAEPLERAVKFDPFRVERVALMRSVLRPGGAVHEPVAEAALG